MTRTAFPVHPLSPRSLESLEQVEELESLESLRRRLIAQRDFRREQLAQLDRQRSVRARSTAHREVYVSLAVGARAALQDAQSALSRMDQGRFGVCVSCGADLDADVLEALPQTARCLSCLPGAPAR